MRRLFFHEESIHEVSRRYLEHEYIHTHTHTHTHTDKPKPICPPLFQSWGHNKVYPCKPQFYYIKVGCKGVFITRTCLHDVLDIETTEILLFEPSFFTYAKSRFLKMPFIMPPTLKKLMGHIAFGACVGGWVRAWVGAWVTLFVPTVTFKPFKLES